MCNFGSCLVKDRVYFIPRIQSHSLLAQELQIREDECFKIEIDWEEASWKVDPWGGRIETDLTQSDVKMIDKWFKENFGTIEAYIETLKSIPIDNPKKTEHEQIVDCIYERNNPFEEVKSPPSGNPEKDKEFMDQVWDWLETKTNIKGFWRKVWGI